MTFEEWWKEFNSCCPLNITDKEIAKWAWGYQQKHIDELNECLEQALSDLKYWEEKAMNLEYDKTLTGDSAV